MSKAKKEEIELVAELISSSCNKGNKAKKKVEALNKEASSKDTSNIDPKILELAINKNKQENIPKNHLEPTKELDSITSLGLKTKDLLKLDNKLNKKCKKKATEALSKLTPGKKALLQSIFMSSKKTTVDDISKKLKEPKEKIEELKADALRSLIYGK